MGANNKRNSMRTKVRSIVFADEMWENLRSLSKRENRSMSDLLREAINDLFAKRRTGTYDPVTDRLTSNFM